MDEIFDSICNGNHIISGDAHDWLNLVFEGSVRIILSKFKHKFDLIFVFLASIWIACDDKFLRVRLFQSMELIKVNEL
jgi:hypothetical protein